MVESFFGTYAVEISFGLSEPTMLAALALLLAEMETKTPWSVAYCTAACSSSVRSCSATPIPSDIWMALAPIETASLIAREISLAFSSGNSSMTCIAKIWASGATPLT